jgi:enoyl-CoA hydratase
MAFQNIIFEIEHGVAWITINRPHLMNALNSSTLTELAASLDEIEKDENILVAVIGGAGEKAFVAGADLEEISKLGLRSSLAYSKRGQGVFSKIEKVGKPVIAAINGLALGGGLELALACTLRVMSEGAKLGFPELGLGGIPGFGGTQRLPRLIGKSRALWYITTGEMIDATKALEIGLVHKVVPQAGLKEECKKIAQNLIKKSPLAMRLALYAIHSGMEIDLEEGLILESALMTVASLSNDKKEGINAFSQKRPPKFTGD